MSKYMGEEEPESADDDKARCRYCCLLHFRDAGSMSQLLPYGSRNEFLLFIAVWAGKEYTGDEDGRSSLQGFVRRA